jgi:coproporphyrinogen III oxidase
VDAVNEATKSFKQFEAHTRDLQLRIIEELGVVEPSRFEVQDWRRADGGGGRMAIVRGDIIEKGAVLVSSVHGSASPLSGKPFRAAGLSLILHPTSPHVPSVHMNIRRFEEPDDAWWGGGIDLTPMGIWHPEDLSEFHETLARMLGASYETGRRAADAYFYVPHRSRPRGAGGVFFDHLREAGEPVIRATGDAFVETYIPLLRRRAHLPFDPSDRARQLKDRGVYVEFNLLYDRGTRFGLQSGGNPDAILSSLPPLVSW